MRVAVFTGSQSGPPAHRDAAAAFAAGLARAGVGVVYGGGHVGLMGQLADAALEAGGHVTGVIPRALWDREMGHRALSDLRVVETMHERKALMASLADAFVALPGGLGTLEEIFEVWTWGQLGIHTKPCGFLDVGGYYTPLLEFLDRAVGAGLVRTAHRSMAIVDDDAERLLRRLAAYEPPRVEKWIAAGET